jgi:transcription elongation GreA/GreB family factor
MTSAAALSAGVQIRVALNTRDRPMSVAFTKEEDNEAAAAYLPERPISPHPNLVTESGLAKLDAALASTKDAVAFAQTNADLKTDRSAMARASRDLRYFTARRASAQLFVPTGEPDLVLFGRRVTFRRDDGRTQSFRIVGEDEADATQGMISHISPIARALLGKRVGSIAALNDSELEIISVE